MKLMEKIDIDQQIQDFYCKISKLEKIKKDYIKLKNKYENLEVYYNNSNNCYFFSMSDLYLKKDYNIEYSLISKSFSSFKELSINRKILDKEFNTSIDVYGDINVVFFDFDDKEIEISFDFYILQKDIIIEIESIIIDELPKRKYKITNRINSEKVQQFIDNLIFM